MYTRRDKEEDDSWIEEQPYHEQLQILKEKKVLSRWQDRTKEWEKIEAQLMRKVNPALAPHTLMINSERQSEFRAQNERYSLMTAVVPAEERFSSTNWVMSLRGGGVTELQIGHLFSGLQCKVVSKVKRGQLLSLSLSLFVLSLCPIFLSLSPIS